MTKHEMVVADDTNELATIEANARREFDDACYAAQAAWYNQNELLHRKFQDDCEDNAANYRAALTKAQRNYRNQTADCYADA
ncbi:MAG TPA: hypothetical protein VIE66_03410 [Methylocella sp.]|jgi:uncharacterized protein (DUF2461 family)